MMDQSLALTDAQTQTEKYWALLKSFPLGNSDFQIEHFVFNHKHDGRNARQAALEMRDTVSALVNGKYNREKSEIDIRRLKAQISKLSKSLAEETDEDKRIEIQCDIDEKELEISKKFFDLKDQGVLEEDAIKRLNKIVEVLQKIPAVDRTEFDKQEKDYWMDRLGGELQMQLKAGHMNYAHLLSLRNAGFNVDEIIAEVKELNAPAEKETLPQLSDGR